ncbi:hypothetical protein [uncultured Brevundimonas sp.]|uniref:hypothetical protein n=1 Tax=uncultured Brevundimonas sp. TaxID=213418 RepID=UPI0025E2D4DF|nr:hypothetical protein [uncultured Brevundimonas sp.]
MTHRHAFRRGVAPRMSDKDVRQWRRLITRASKLRLDSSPKIVRSFVIAAEKAAKCIMPAGQRTVASPFSQLVRLGEAWFRPRPDAQRAEDLTTVSDLATRCGALLDQDEPAQDRKDIYG